MRNEKGITLIELMATISILGIILGIAVPNLLPVYDQWAFKSAVSEMVLDIRQTQHLAITTGYDYEFHLNTVNKYYLVKSSDSRVPAYKRVELDKGVRSISSNLLKSGEYDVLAFNPLGTPARPGTIEILSSSGRTAKITIDLVTGRVKSYEN